jgi:hypothetical protein
MRTTRTTGLKILTTLLLCLMLISPLASASATETLEVKAYGSAVNSGNSATTRGAALQGAIRDAVATAVKEYLEKNGLSADEQALAKGLYSRADGFVLNYKILSERWISETPELPGTEATTSESTGPTDTPLPGASAEAGTAGTESGAPSAGGQPTVGPPAPPPPTYHVLINATLDMGAIRKAVIRVLGAGETGAVRLVMLDISDYETFRSLLASLRRISVIEDISYRSFARDRFVAQVRTVMDPATLAEEIGREAGPDFVAAAYGVNTIIIKAFPGPDQP